MQDSWARRINNIVHCVRVHWPETTKCPSLHSVHVDPSLHLVQLASLEVHSGTYINTIVIFLTVVPAGYVNTRVSGVTKVLPI